ncbi:MAG: putative toxin-antitoxin system toxin component, PIN family [Bacteroidales bacterium]
MTSRIFIIDTNVVAAALITGRPDSPTARILDAMISGSLIYLLSADLLNEYRHVLLRPKLARLHRLQPPEIEQILIELTANAIWRDPPTDRAHHSPDPCDCHLWDLLASEPAAILITGDKLLIDNPGPQRSVISPATWIQTFR